MLAGLVSPEAPPGRQMLPLPCSWVVASAGVPYSPSLKRISLNSSSLNYLFKDLISKYSQSLRTDKGLNTGSLKRT